MKSFRVNITTLARAIHQRNTEQVKYYEEYCDELVLDEDQHIIDGD